MESPANSDGALLWFHPLVWRIRLVHADACDEVCDSIAADYLGDGGLYGRLLAELAIRTSGREHLAALAMVRPSRIRHRIQTVLRNRPCGRLPIWQTAVVFTLSCLTVSAIGTVDVGRSDELPQIDGVATFTTGESGTEQLAPSQDLKTALASVGANIEQIEDGFVKSVGFSEPPPAEWAEPLTRSPTVEACSIQSSRSNREDLSIPASCFLISSLFDCPIRGCWKTDLRQ